MLFFSNPNIRIKEKKIFLRTFIKGFWIKSQFVVKEIDNLINKYWFFFFCKVNIFLFFFIQSAFWKIRMMLWFSIPFPIVSVFSGSQDLLKHIESTIRKLLFEFIPKTFKNAQTCTLFSSAMQWSVKDYRCCHFLHRFYIRSWR